MFELYNSLFENVFLASGMLVLWFILLIKWATFLVDWSSSVASKMWVSPIVIWLTIVAFGTSMPELMVDLLAVYNWDTASLNIAVSSILWSNFANILLILWATALICPIKMVPNTIFKEIPFSLLAVIALFLLMSDQLFGWSSSSQLSRNEALVLLCFFIIFIYYVYILATTSKWKSKDKIQKFSTGISVLFIFLWLIWLVLGGNFVVNSAISIATKMNIPAAFIGLTIVALWTSLPELVTSIVAARKNNIDMAVWNVVWSNIFNILWVLWIAGSFSALPSYDSFLKDIWLVIFATTLLFIFALTWWRHIISQREWIIFLCIYFGYIWYSALTL